MMKETQHSTYRLPYQQCKTHMQKLNYICLDPHCHQGSLICSLCKDENKHSKHLVRPLKFYLQELQQKYQKQQKQSELNEMLNDLDLNHYKFYEMLKKTVEEIAEEFRKLQEQVTQQIASIKNEIHEQISKRSRFQQFYDSLKKGDIDHSNFLIQNYLPQASLGKISNLDCLEKLSKDICLQIQSTKSNIIQRQSIDLTKKENMKQAFNVLDLNTAMKRPINITFDGNVLKQTSTMMPVKSLCLIDFPVSSLSGKLSFKMLQLKKLTQVIIGAMPKSVYESMNEQWKQGKLDQNSFVLSSVGYLKGWTKKEITSFGQGSTLEICCRNGEFKIIQKNKVCLVKIPTNIDLFVFIALIGGNTQVKVTHLK